MLVFEGNNCSTLKVQFRLEEAPWIDPAGRTPLTVVSAVFGNEICSLRCPVLPAASEDIATGRAELVSVEAGLCSMITVPEPPLHNPVTVDHSTEHSEIWTWRPVAELVDNAEGVKS